MKKEIIVDSSPKHALETTSRGESLLEMRLHVLLEHEKKVLKYDYQAVPKNREGKFEKLQYLTLDSVLVKWVPDVTVIWENGNPWIVEVKTLREVRDNLKKLLNKFNQAKQRAAENGWLFYVFTDAHLSDSFRVDNLLDLESQIGFHTKECIETILDCFYEQDTWTMVQLQERLIKFPKSVVLSSVYYLIYNGELFIDLDKELNLNMAITSNPNDYVPLDAWLQRYSWKKDWKKKLEEESPSILDENQFSEEQRKKYEREKTIILARKQGMSIKQIMIKFEIPRRSFYNLWKKSEKGRNLNGLLRKSGSGRLKHELFATNKNGKPKFLDSAFEQAIKLYEKPEKPDSKQCWKHYLFLKRELAWQQGLTDDNTTPYNELQRAFKEAGITLPSRDIFYRELQRYAREYKKRVLMKREGFKVGLKATRDITGSTPMMNYIGQMCQIDHTLGDIIPVIPFSIYREQDKKKKGRKSRTQYMERPAITVVIDVHTRVILGYAFRYRRPSRETTFIALRRTVLGKINPLLSPKEQKELSTTEKILKGFRSMVSSGLIEEENYNMIEKEFDSNSNRLNLRHVADWWDNLRVMPRLLHTDNGSDFTSKDIEEWTRRYSVKLAIRPVGGANYGGHVERVLGTLNKQGFYILPGTTKGSAAKRGDYPSEKKALFTFDQLEAIFLLTILKYHVTIHTTLGIPPSEAWKQAVDEGHNLLPSELSGEKAIKEFAYNTLTLEKRSYLLNEGIKIGGIKYNYEKQLSADKSWSELYLKGSDVEVRTDSSDIRFIWWWNPSTERPVRVWASKIRFGNKEYGKNKLKRFPAISQLQYQDLRAANELDVEQTDIFERLENRADNIFFGMVKGLPKNKRERQVRAREITIEQVAKGELEETSGFLTGAMKNQIDESSSKLLSRKEGKIEKSEDDESWLDEEDDDIEPYETDIEKIRKEIVGRFSYRDKENH
jgi:transposase InsO family protein